MPRALRMTVAIGGAVVALSDPPAGEDLNADARPLVAQPSGGRAIGLAKERRLVNATRFEQHRELDLTIIASVTEKPQGRTRVQLHG